MSMTSDEIRERYLSFFEERGHQRVPSASLVPSAHDPSALLTVAGMHPLKPYFLGQEAPPAPRLTSCQKVFRTVDIDNVGNTARHLTFFEMLGNFSFGDYFKQDAIAFAHELLTSVYGIDKSRLIYTVHYTDDDAAALWRKVAGVGDDRVIRLGDKDNFWAMGETGPCGPCSEIHYHQGDGSPCAE